MQVLHVAVFKHASILKNGKQLILVYKCFILKFMENMDRSTILFVETKRNFESTKQGKYLKYMLLQWFILQVSANIFRNMDSRVSWQTAVLAMLCESIRNRLEML